MDGAACAQVTHSWGVATAVRWVEARDASESALLLVPVPTESYPGSHARVPRLVNFTLSLRGYKPFCNLWGRTLRLYLP